MAGKTHQASTLIRSRIVGHGDVNPAELLANPLNFRRHPGNQMDALRGSMKELGWLKTILVNKTTGHVLDGHARVEEAMRQGLPTIPATLVELTEDEERLALAVLDPITEMATRDQAILDELLAEVATNDAGLQALLDELAGKQDEVPTSGLKDGVDPDAVPEPPKVPVTKPGDIITLGRHRLMCGDSTSLDNFIKLMGGESPAVCITDPPYGLGDKKESGKNDYHAYVDSRENLEKLARGWLPIARENCRAVVFSPGVTNAWIYPEANWIMCWFYGGGQLRSSWGFNCWQPFLCYGKDPSLATGNGGRPDGVNMNTPANSGDLDHPCPKPVALWDWLIDRLSFVENEIIYEPFGGSGTTFIACEKKNRRCYGMELDPIYCDVIIRRWEEATGRKAERHKEAER